MEKSDSIAVETNCGVVGGIMAADVGGGMVTVKEIPIAGENEKNKKDTIAIEDKGVSEKIGKIMKKNVSVSKVGSGDDETTEAVVVKSEVGVNGCRIQVSNIKKPLFFYVNLAKRYIKHNNVVELSGLGMAIPTVVTIAEILKKDGWAIEKDITISSVPLMRDDAKGRVVMKAKIEIILEKTKKLEKDGLVVAEGPSEISEANELLSETNEKVFEMEDQFDANGSLTEKNKLENALIEFIKGKEVSTKDANLKEKKDASGNMTENTDNCASY